MATTTRDRAGARTEARLVERFLTAYVGGDPETMGEVVTEDCIVHQVRWPKDTVGRETLVADAAEMETFTGVTIDVEDVVVEGDRVAAYVTASGRNVGAVKMEGREIAPTGETFEVPQFGIYRLEGDRIAEAWVLADALGIVQQLDNFPAGPGKMLGILGRQLSWRLRGRPRLD